MSRSPRTYATILRLVTLASRFFLIFFLARLLPVDEVGFYGLFTATIAYMLFIVGFDFYTYSTRELIRSERETWPSKLRSHVSFTAVLYAIFIPASALLFVFGFLPWSALPWFLILLPLEHIGQEIDRVLIAIGDNLAASIALFMGQATTPFLLIPLMIAFPALRTIETVMAGWVLVDLLSIIIAGWYLKKHLGGLPKGKTEWAWIRVGIKVSLLFLVSTLCLRSFFVVDRQVINKFDGLETLGVYTLFMGIAAGLTNVVAAGIHQFIYPRLVASAAKNDGVAFRKSFKELGLQTVIVLAVLSALAIFGTPLLLSFIGKPEYADSAWVLPWALGVISLYNLSLVPHFALYAVHADKWLLWSTIIATVGFVLTIVLVLPLGGMQAALSAIGVASLIMLIAKSIGVAIKNRHLLGATPDGTADA